MKQALITVASILAACAVAAAAQPVPYLPVPKGAAVILNTGSTNTTGYRIVVAKSGVAQYTDGANRASGKLSPTLTAKLFRDLHTSMPLSKLRFESCMKSASFGTSVFVWWRGERSPDVSCPGDATLQTLGVDADAVAAALGVSSAPRGQAIRMLPNEPRKSIPTPAQSPNV